jgi:dTDP-4-amino-4,6-dideoxygalactose transaminase
LALVAAGVRQGDEVITTPFTFVSTVNVILHQGAKPVFADIDRETYNIDPSKIEQVITKKTKAIVAVHFAGQPCDMDEISKIAKKYNLILIEDAAHAFGSEYKEKKIGTISDFTCFSFYAAKNLTTAEGGMIVAKSDKMAEKIKILSLHGMSRDAWKRYLAGGSWYYEVIYPGYKYNMPDILASLGIHQLRKIEKFISKKEKIADIYKKELGFLGEIIIPKVKDKVRHSWYLYPILINQEFLKIKRDKFIEALKAENIGASVHFIPVHLHPFYKKKFGFKKGDFPNSEYVYNRIVSLPIHSAMSFNDAKDVVRAVKKIINYYS